MTKKRRMFFIICGAVCGVGILLTALGYALGGQKGFAAIEERVSFVDLGNWGPQKTETKSLDAFTSMDIRSDLGEVNFIQGDKYQVEITYPSSSNKPQIRVSGGKLTVVSTEKRGRILGLGFLRGNEKTTVNVYYPKGATFNAVKVTGDLGEVEIKDLTTKTLELNAALGDIDLETVKADSIVAKLDLGDFEANNITTKGLDLELSQGVADIQGTLYGRTKVFCDLGDCEITTDLPKSQYAVTTDIDLGDCEINGESIDGEYTIDSPSAKNRMDFQCDLGDLSINFQ